MPRFDRTRLLHPDLADGVRARRALALDLAEAAIDAVEPEAATREALRRVGAPEGMVGFAFGKASVAMARAARAYCDRGILIALASDAPADGSMSPFRVFRGAHPDPAPDAEVAGRAVRDLALSLGARDTALCLVSGGGSSMLELARPPMDLPRMIDLQRRLREGGASIAELNAVRRCCSALKGGGLARLAAPASVLNIVVSDVPGHPVEVVASGPGSPPPPGPDARDVLERHGIDVRLPEPATGGLPPIRTEVAAGPTHAIGAIVVEGANRGLSIERRQGVFDGDASTLGRSLARSAASSSVSAPWAWAGETTVVVRGHGRGGRNQEVALGALAEGWPGGLLLAFGTDGIDGKSDAAGALVDTAVVDEARRRGLDPSRFLEDNDSTTFFDLVGGTLRSGPTGTNVADVCVYLP